MRRCCLLVLWYSLIAGAVQGQNLLSLTPADSLHKARLWTAVGSGSLAYGVAMTGLYQAWYADYPQSQFHTFNDLREWNQMDKMGHALMSFQESRWTYGLAHWIGVKPNKAAWAGFAGAQLIQTSLETLDGFSEQWGWSWSDVGFNVLGSGLFLSQQLGWGEQRICLKMSALPINYPSEPIHAIRPFGSTQTTSFQARSEALYGKGPVNLFLKNYNTLVVWASVNPRSMLGSKANWCPAWLNLAFGMGADNLYAGFGYEWQADKNCQGPDCLRFQVDSGRYPRTRQFFLSPDIDLTRIPVKGKFWKALLYTANIFKFPAPALSWSNRGDLGWHWMYW